MHLRLSHSKESVEGFLRITGSKSESNRLLLLKALYPQIAIENLSNSDDTLMMQRALKGEDPIVDIHHAGTAMRFLTAYFSIQEGREVLLTGSSRMKQRPIGILVDALRQLGATIAYTEKEGCPPLKIKGTTLPNNKVSLPANVSSQYISALLLIGSKLPNGLTLYLEGKVTSGPYIKMTLRLLEQIGVQWKYNDRAIQVFPAKDIKGGRVVVESDWSSASYFFSVVALSDDAEIVLRHYRSDSLQGDSVARDIYRQLGVEVSWVKDGMLLKKKEMPRPKAPLEHNMADCPDLAQTVAVSCFGLGMGCDLYGLHTLKIKETDRLEALCTELTKLGASIAVTDRSLHLQPSPAICENISIDTYEDHRMAMAFAPLALKVPIHINNAEVVSKSYPDFWNDLNSIGFVQEQF